MADFVFAILEAVVWFGLYLLFFRLWMRMFPSTIPYYAIAGMVMTWPSFLVFLFLSIILLFSMGADIGSAIFLCFSVALCRYSVWLPVRIVRNVSHVTPCSFWGVWRRALLAFLFAFMVGTAVWAGANALAFSGFSHFMEHSEFSRSRGLGPTFMVMLGHGRPVPIRKQGCLACMLEVKSIHVKDNVETNVKGRVETDKPRAGERQIEYDGAAPGFRYIGADLDDSATVRRTFAWFADDGTKEASFSLILPRNVDRLVETDAGEDYVRPVELLVAEYPRKPFLHLWASGYPVSYWPSPETLPYARRVGMFRDGEDDLLVYSVAREEVVGKPMLHGSDSEFDGVLLYVREVPEAKGLRMRVTDMVARKTLPDKAELNNALDDLRRHWTSGPGSKVIGNLFMERVTPAIRRQSLLVWEDNRTGVFAHWENAESGGFVLYMILTDKWGYKGGVNRRVHGNTVTAAAKAESPLSALVRGRRSPTGNLCPRRWQRVQTLMVRLNRTSRRLEHPSTDW